MPITIYPGSMKKRNANGSYSDLVPAIATDPEVLDDFAEEYSTSETYNIGDYCIHNSDLYKCNTNNTTGTWNNNAWDRVSVADELVDHKNTLNQLDQNMAYVESGNTASRTYTYGQFISWKGTLYTVSDQNGIPMGTAFAVGTNLAVVVDGNGDLCGGLNRLKSSLPSHISYDTIGYLNGLSTTDTESTLLSGHTFSEYDMVLILFDDSSARRGEIILPRAIFAASTTTANHIVMYIASTTILGIVTYVSDTAFKARISASAAISLSCKIYGIKIS